MENQSLQRYIPEHPLPQEIQEMHKDDTVCQFCGVSYLIHNEMKALEERVKEAEKQMEYYKESVEREKRLKEKVKIMEEESNKLSRMLQASEESSEAETLEKNWSEIRTSLNQKCLDNLKVHRKNIKDEGEELMPP